MGHLRGVSVQAEELVDLIPRKYSPPSLIWHHATYPPSSSNPVSFVRGVALRFAPLGDDLHFPSSFRAPSQAGAQNIFGY